MALKGIGGFQLIVDARNDNAVRRLRQRKHRDEKPFALLYPSLEAAREDCRVGEFEQRLLLSPESPIVLLERQESSASNRKSALAPSVAPRNPYLGLMLPYSPLHHLFMRELGFPVIATSGNLSDEPICTDEREALARLRGIADVFLVHDRPIVRHVDDSVVRVMLGRELVMRRARGYAPLPVAQAFQPAASRDFPVARSDGEMSSQPRTNMAGESAPATVLAVGAHLKSTIALSVGPSIFLSQHIGDLETEPAFAAFRQVTADFEQLYEATPEVVACDLHPEYLSTKHARQIGVPVVPVQHHYAHVLSCMADNELEAPVLGVSWDGTGYGLDGTIWGGEFLLVTDVDESRADSADSSSSRPSPLYPISGGSTGDSPVPSGNLPDGTRPSALPQATCPLHPGASPVPLGESPSGAGKLPALPWPNACSPGERGRTVARPGTTAPGFVRIAHLRPFRLPGGEAAIKQPRRSALGMLYEIFGDSVLDRHNLPVLTHFSDGERTLLRQMLAKGLNAPWTSSAGRLFDAVSALIGLHAGVQFEGQAAMELEFALAGIATDERYEWAMKTTPSAKESDDPPALVLDWEPMVLEILEDIRSGHAAGVISSKFHNTMAEAIVAVARDVGEPKVALTGGCFQNKYLTERTVRRLREEGFRPYWHQRVPPNDGGIAVGQAMAAIRFVRTQAAIANSTRPTRTGKSAEPAGWQACAGAPGS